MALSYPNGEDTGNEISAGSFTLVGTGVDAPWKGVTNPYDDTKYVRATGNVGVIRFAITFTPAENSSGVNVNTMYLNIRLRRTGTVPAGSFIQLTAFSTDEAKYIRPNNIDLTLLNTSFTDYNLQGSAWNAFGANNGTIWVTLSMSSGSASVDVSHLSFGTTAEVASINYAQPGGASVTMTGSAAVATARTKTGAGAAAAMSGSAAPLRGKPVNSQLNSYFFLPPGATVGIVDDGNPYQGWGTKPLNKRERDE